MKFSDFELDQRILDGLEALQYKEPTPIQRDGIPVALKRQDIIGLAQTGTGKTGAFVIPILQDVISRRDTDDEPPHALILTPTRELAKQVDEMIFAMGYHTGVSSATVIGGEDFSAQARHIRDGVDILVATPGRLLDILNVLNFSLNEIRTLVLDEADRMLDMGFYPDVSKIVGKLPKDRHTMLFSATMSSQIEKLSKQIMKQPKRLEFAVSKPVDTVEQHAYFVDNKQKLNLVEKLFDHTDWESAIVFAATKKWTEKLHQKLQQRGVNSVSIHGDRSQDERNEALYKFKSGQNPVIVATDVLSRGIDIDNVSMIVNYDLPQNSDDYIHRIGRTGRHKKSGLAVTFVNSREKGKYRGIKQEVKLDIKEYPASALLDSSDDEEKQKKSRQSDQSDKNDKQREKKSQRDDNKRKRSRQKKSSSSEKSRPKSRSKSSSSKSDDDKSGKRSRDNAKKNTRSSSQQKDKSKEDSSSSGRSKRTRKKQKKSKSKKTSNNGSRKSGKSEKSRNSSKREQAKEKEQNKVVVRRIEKAIQRNKNTREPAKGVWGIIKSLIPKLGQD